MSSSSSSTAPSGAPPLGITIRFSNSIPDLPLSIPSPATTTTLYLKCQIRLLRHTETSTRRLRLIHAGKVLQDSTPLSDSLRSVLPRPLPPSPRSSAPLDITGKGKAKATKPPTPPPQEQQNIYLICSVGDELTAAKLAAEQDAANAPTTVHSTSTSPPTITAHHEQPRGFDRLLTAGFTPAEVAQLRAQFLQLQSHAYTPDTMPSAAELRALEDRWIDDSAGPGGTSTGEMGGIGEAGGGYEDMLLGTMMGFFWPLGAVVWLLREEGVWSKRRQMAVVAGMLVNVAFSVLRNTS